MEDEEEEDRYIDLGWLNRTSMFKGNLPLAGRKTYNWGRAITITPSLYGFLGESG